MNQLLPVFLFNRGFNKGEVALLANSIFCSLHQYKKMSMSMPMPTPPSNMPMPTPSDSMYNNNNSSMDMKNMIMHMSFFWGKDVIVLFQGWPGDSLGLYILAAIFVFFLAFAVEVLSISQAFRPGKWNPLVTSLIHAGAYALKIALAYMVMLSVMSFNIGIFIVAVVGHAVGCFLVKYRSFVVAARAEPTI